MTSTVRSTARCSRFATVTGTILAAVGPWLRSHRRRARIRPLRRKSIRRGKRLEYFPATPQTHDYDSNS